MYKIKLDFFCGFCKTSRIILKTTVFQIFHVHRFLNFDSMLFIYLSRINCNNINNIIYKKILFSKSIFRLNVFLKEKKIKRNTGMMINTKNTYFNKKKNIL